MQGHAYGQNSKACRPCAGQLVFQILWGLYKDCTTTIRATDGETDAIPICRGVK